MDPNSFMSLSWELYKCMNKDDTNNILISAVSISAALSMTLAGAVNETAKEMIHGLQLQKLLETAGGDNNEKLHMLAGESLKSVTVSNTLSMVNRVYAQQSYKLAESFTQLVQKAYGGDFVSANFIQEADKVTKEINKWVSDATKGKIPDLLPPGLLNSLTRLVLVNAVHFKGSWMSKFRVEDTIDDDFYVKPSEKHRVKMMRMKADMRFNSNVGEHHTSPAISAITSLLPPYQAVALPFKQDAGDVALFFVVILPQDMQKFEEMMHSAGDNNVFRNAEWLAAILEDLLNRQRRPNIDVTLKLPRFKLAPAGGSIKKHLMQLGIKLAFSDAADLSGITGEINNALFITDVVHQALLEVNEEGAEAAAATAAVVGFRCAPRPKQVEIMEVNKPCFVMIAESSMLTPLFFGKLVKPEELH